LFSSYYKYIDNVSSETLDLTLYSNSYIEPVITASIVPGQLIEVFEIDHERSFSGPEYTCSDEIDSVKIVTLNGAIFVGDFQNIERWMRESSGGRMSREDCTFEILDSNFE